MIITIGSAGAIIIKTDSDPAANEYTLVFDPQFMENEWEETNMKEIINQIGHGSSFLAGFTASVSLKELSTADSVKVGLNTMTAAMLNGVFKLNEKYLFQPADLSTALKEKFKKRYYSSAYVPSPAWAQGLAYLQNPEWSILENNYDNKNGKEYIPKPDLFPLAFSLAEIGIDNLHYAPRLALGSVTLFDRNEIENMRNIRRQVDFYDHYENGKKPLNISVFGPPGAGKSFIVKAMASSMFEGKKTKPSFLTFNLSQFKDESELPGAFHSIRDEVLKGKLPIVFWDEFDSNDYGWLKSLIAPMQDGEFQEGKEVHPIGKAIFVFAGGMTYTMQHFADKMEKPEYVGRKGPDFLSRINCSLNVFGPNRKPFYDVKTKQWIKEGDEKDNCFSIRRALFIRQLLGSGDKPIHIDLQLLRTIIEVNCYKNGSRGLERLLKNLAVQNSRKIERSDLPSTEIIQMNVDYDDFMNKLSDESSAENMVFEKIAVSVHNAWLEKSVAHSVYYKQYNDLSYDMRIDNISAAKRIKEVIEKTGKFILISQPQLKSRMLADAKTDFDKYLEGNAALDKLAEWEHKGWMKTRESANWKPGKRSDYHKIHNCMVPFSKLDIGIKDRAKQKEKNKDRDSLKKYTSMLEGSGFTITIK
ncbi:MAG: RyR domain-containing protein [Bacteroidetes bacterium]|nr:RyR domain-containing protein [Bacteroidota bacterium]